MAQKKFIIDGGFNTNADSSITGNLDMTGHIIPTVDSDGVTGYDLGTPDMKWRDLYLSKGSLYIDGQKVLESDSGTIVVRADEDQSMTVKTTGTGVLTLQSEQTVNFAATMQMAVGKKITSAAGEAVVFGDKIDLDNNQMINVGAPTADGHAVTKGYVDTLVGNISTDAIIEGDTEIEIADLATGTIGFTVDGAQKLALSAGSAAFTVPVTVNNVALANVTDVANALSTAESYTDSEIANLIGSAPGALDTLNELAAALGDDANFAATTTNAIATAQSTAIATAESYTDAREVSITNAYNTAISVESTAIANAYATAISTSETNITNAYETYADAAESAAVSTAAADATSKADAAESAAVATAAADATSKADAAESAAISAAALDATSKADAAESAAVSTAAADATSKADAAESAAISAAALDATSKADAAVATAALDATSKASQALTSAQSYADSAEADAVATASADATAKVSAEATARATAIANATATASADATAKAGAAESNAKSYTDTKVADLVDAAPGTLDTLNELAAALGDDPNFATTTTNAIAAKMSSLVEDTTPQLGGTLDVNGKTIEMSGYSRIASFSGDNIEMIAYGGTGNPGDIMLTTFAEVGDRGNVIIDGIKHPTADGAAGEALVTDGAGNLSFANVSNFTTFHERGANFTDTEANGIATRQFASIVDAVHYDVYLNRVLLRGPEAGVDGEYSVQPGGYITFNAGVVSSSDNIEVRGFKLA